MPDEPQHDLAVRRYGDPCLRRRCRDVAVGEDVSRLVAGMFRTMESSQGVGLAAPQVGDLRRVVTIIDPGQRPPLRLALINPVIEERFGPDAPFEEGCLSFPDLFLTLWRRQGMQVRYRDRDGREVVLRDERILARIVQHEVDHLEGILFIDHLPRWRRWLLGWRLMGLRRNAGKDAA